MFVVIFEVRPKPDRLDDYLRYAALLTPEVAKVDGFIHNERFESRRRDGWLVSVSTWRDEKALIRWRTMAVHHAVQERGRADVFRDYHLRVGEVVADTRLPEGQVLPGCRFDATEVGVASVATLTERQMPHRPSDASVDALAALLGGTRGGTRPDPLAWDLFVSISRPGALLLLNCWPDTDSAERWIADASDAARHRTVRIIRDYGMFDRAEAPQYHPPVKRGEIDTVVT